MGTGWVNSHDITTGEDRVNDGELVAQEAQIFLHAGDIGLCQVGTIQIIHEVHHAAEGQNKKIQLPHQLLLRRRTLLGVEIGAEFPHDCGAASGQHGEILG